MQALAIGTKEVRCDAAGLVSLTDLYVAAGSQGLANGKSDAREWTRAPRARKSVSTGKALVSGGAGWDFIAAVAGTLNVGTTHILKSVRGAGGGTYAHWQIALAYAKYLSPELHMQVNEVYARAKSGDITLADEVADRASPEDQERHAKRMAGKVARNRLASTLQQHGVQGRGFGDCTNGTYRGLFGGSKKEICLMNGLPYKKGRSLRDTMSVEDLIATSMAELVAAKQIEKYNLRGNAPCADECERAARNVASLLR